YSPKKPMLNHAENRPMPSMRGRACRGGIFCGEPRSCPLRARREARHLRVIGDRLRHERARPRTISPRIPQRSAQMKVTLAQCLGVERVRLGEARRALEERKRALSLPEADQRLA